MISRRGSVLILVLFVLVVLSLFALSLTYRAGLEVRSARVETRTVTLDALNRSAVAVALSGLSENTNDFDHLAEPWHDHALLSEPPRLPEWDVEPGQEGAAYETDYLVVDEDGKLNVLFASGEALEDLGFTPGQVDAFFDWMDPDSDVRPAGAEDRAYAGLPLPYRAKNAEIEVLEELLLLQGVSRAQFDGEDWNRNRRLDPEENDGPTSEPLDDADGTLRLGLVDLLTAVGDGKINLNTAPREVLETLPISDEAVDQIVGFRAFDRDSRGDLADHVFRGVADIEQLQGLSDEDRAVLSALGKFTSQHYRIAVRSKHVDTGVSRGLSVVVEITSEGPVILLWHP